MKTFSFHLTAKGDTTSKSTYSHEGNLTKQINDIKEIGSIDTIWFDNEKIVKIIGSNYKWKAKHKSVITYNDKGDEIENVSYR